MPLASQSITVVSSGQVAPGVIENSDIADGAIDNAKVNASAAIVDSKLAQIATASKVSGAALTSLASIPAGAGVIPAANIPAGFAELANVAADGSSVTLASGTFTAKQFLIAIINIVDVASASVLKIRFNGASGALYSSVISLNGGASAARDAADGIEPSSAGGTYDYPMVIVLEIIANVATVRKAGFMRTAELGNAGTLSPNAIVEGAFTWNNTTDQITSVSIVSGAGNISSGSRIIVFGSPS